jgi:hypothetical protein
VTSDPSGVYVAALQTENIESAVIKLSPDGKSRLWSQQLPADPKGQLIPWEGARSLASDGGELYLLGHRFPQRVHVSDAKSGQPHRALGIDWEPPFPDRLPSEAIGGGTAMTVHRGTIVVAYAARDAVCWFDAKTGAHLATAHVPAPAGVAVDGTGAALVTTNDRVVRLTRARPVPVTLRANLNKPGPLTVDPTTGDVLVFEAGRQQVVRLPRGTARRSLCPHRLSRRHGAVGRSCRWLLRRRALRRPSPGGGVRPKRRGRAGVVRRSAVGHRGRLRARTP